MNANYSEIFWSCKNINKFLGYEIPLEDQDNAFGIDHRRSIKKYFYLCKILLVAGKKAITKGWY